MNFHKCDQLLYTVVALTDLSHEPIGAAERRLNLGADADESSGHRVLQLVLLREQRHDAREYRRARQLAVRVFAHEPGPDLEQ